jgi:hypothetical protein
LKKLVASPLLLLLGCLTAGLYGMLHNQISYTVSPDYFEQFKFIQFNVAPSLQGRVGASLVGWAASWWMGLIISAFLLPMGAIILGDNRYFIAIITAYGIVACTAFSAGLLALLYAYVTVDATTVEEVIRYGQEIDDPVAFTRAATMHNFSYLGGLLGIVTGSAWLFFERRRANLTLTRDSSAPSTTPRLNRNA